MPQTFGNGQLYIGGEWAVGRGAPITSVFAAEGVKNQTLNGASREGGAGGRIQMVSGFVPEGSLARSCRN